MNECYILVKALRIAQDMIKDKSKVEKECESEFLWAA